jgi:hypothetical protein
VPFIEHRTYTLKPGRNPSLPEIYGAEGFAIHETHAPCAGFYTTEAGALFQLISLWAVRQLRAEARTARGAYARPDWRERMEALSPLWTRMKQAPPAGAVLAAAI